jgi:hypothetical protein
MKRSEIINKIAVYFLENQGGTTPLKLAEDILTIVEEAGMLPPRIWVDCEEWSDEASPKWDNSQRIEGEPLSGLIGWKKRTFTWEPENDK